MKRILLAMLFALSFFTACAKPAAPAATPEEPDAVSEATAERYREGELRVYDGVRLDPSVGPRDNSISGIQYVDIADFTLTVDGLAGQPNTYLYDEITALPFVERLVTIYCVEGWSAAILWKGVPLMTLIEAAKPQAETNTVIFHAVDGYTTSLPLKEIAENDLMLAYGANGLALPPEMGYPFIVVAEDKWGYKWARWVNRIELSSDASYEGFWESNGYSNQGDLDQPSR